MCMSKYSTFNKHFVLLHKGWKFYNLTTQPVVISERAEFDECFFPGFKKTTDSVSLPIQMPTLPTSAAVADDADDEYPVWPLPPKPYLQSIQ